MDSEAPKELIDPLKSPTAAASSFRTFTNRSVALRRVFRLFSRISSWERLVSNHYISSQRKEREVIKEMGIQKIREQTSSGSGILERDWVASWMEPERELKRPFLGSFFLIWRQERGQGEEISEDRTDCSYISLKVNTLQKHFEFHAL